MSGSAQVAEEQEKLPTGTGEWRDRKVVTVSVTGVKEMKKTFRASYRGCMSQSIAIRWNRELLLKEGSERIAGYQSGLRNSSYGRSI
jgi:hypothetical protein